MQLWQNNRWQLCCRDQQLPDPGDSNMPRRIFSLSLQAYNTWILQQRQLLRNQTLIIPAAPSSQRKAVRRNTRWIATEVCVQSTILSLKTSGLLLTPENSSSSTCSTCSTSTRSSRSVLPPGEIAKLRTRLQEIRRASCTTSTTSMKEDREACNRKLSTCLRGRCLNRKRQPVLSRSRNRVNRNIAGFSYQWSLQPSALLLTILAATSAS